ncbi:MAG: hypothetical protein K9W44_09045 [Candidatus Lokiarchaeota archaeon]|nr:hypothetical protein [Candidatus Harpocratesius repetitus]
MRKLILVQWDIRLGPNALVQFPPEPNFPPNELLLKIWAKHETTPNSNFISFLDTSNKKKYCSLLKKSQSKNETFFILLELDIESDEHIYREILENVGNELIFNYNKPHFTHILSDTYRAIKNYAEMDEKQLYFRLFEDNIRIHILQTLRNGCISKAALREKLRSQFGYIQLNLDLLLTPFIRLRLIKVMQIPGDEESIFLLSDFFVYRTPLSFRPANKVIEKKIQRFFLKDQILSDREVHQLVPLFEHIETLQLINLITLHKDKGISYSAGLELLKDKKNLLIAIEEADIIDTTQDNKIFLISDIQFHSFKPKYLIPILQKRYLNKEISLEQLMKQLELII